MNIMVFTDTHTHLYLTEFDPDRDQMLERAIQAGVQKFFLPNIDITSIDALLALTRKYPARCFPMMGLHPCSVKENYAEELAVVEQWLSDQKFYAVGEIGIDLYWDKTFFKQQQEAFRKQIGLALKYNLPIVIHSRNSFNEVLEIVQEMNSPKLKGIFHCFSGTLQEAQKVISLGGFKMGIGGVATFKNGGLDKVLPEIALEHIVLETDAPYLAPVPYRGKRNESAYIAIIAAKIAEIKGVNIEKVAEITTANSLEIFGV